MCLLVGIKTSNDACTRLAALFIAFHDQIKSINSVAMYAVRVSQDERANDQVQTRTENAGTMLTEHGASSYSTR